MYPSSPCGQFRRRHLPRSPRPSLPAISFWLAVGILGLALALARPAAAQEQRPATLASSADAQALAQRALAATCANCHGTDGRSAPGSELPSLAGQPKAFVVEQLNAFRNGSRPATVMHQLAKGYSPAQIEALAAYFAAQPR